MTVSVNLLVTLAVIGRVAEYSKQIQNTKSYSMSQINISQCQ